VNEMNEVYSYLGLADDRSVLTLGLGSLPPNRLALDLLPYTALGYANGPSAVERMTVIGRKNLTDVDTGTHTLLLAFHTGLC